MLATSRRCGVGVKTHILWKVRVLLAGLECCHLICMLAMNLTLQSRITVPILTALVILGSLLAPPPNESRLLAQDTDTQIHDPKDPLQELFRQLDARSFKAREAATERLIKRGPEILEPLALYFLNCSSEAGWRIHRILEGVGKNGQEEDFLKSVALIDFLYGAQDPKSQQRLAGLQFGWMTTRRTEAAGELNKRGFKFTAAASGYPELPRDPMLEGVAIERIRIDGLRVAGGFEIATGPETKETKKEVKPAVTEWTNPRLDRQKSIVEVQQIINNSTDENRRVVEKLLSPAVNLSLPAGTLKFPKGWEPDKESLKLINELGSISSLTFQEQKIDADLQKFISGQNKLNALELIDCEFDSKSDKLSLPSSINTLGLQGSLPPPASFRSLAQVRTLKLSKVELEEDVAYAISQRKIQMLELEEVEFTRESIARMVNMQGLFRVTMSLCKFELEWLDDIRRKNPNIIFPEPKAFLGVQGPIPVTGTDGEGCQISQIVPDQAAAAAGMQPLDIITVVDGQKVTQFEDLRLMISQKRPGDSMSVQVRRGDKTLDLNIELGDISDSSQR